MPHRVVGYRCSNCRKHYEDELYMPGDKIKKVLKHRCPDCGGVIKMWNFKKNDQNWKYMDTRR
jgi:DNA-directed RNA polymerase subunit RPC12/RpoP